MNTFNPSKRPVMESTPATRPARRQRITASLPKTPTPHQPLPNPAPTRVPILPSVIPPAAPERKKMPYTFTSQRMVQGIFYIELLTDEFPKWNEEKVFLFFFENKFKIKLSDSDFKEHTFTSEALKLLDNQYTGTKLLFETSGNIVADCTTVGSESSKAFSQLITWIQGVFKP